MNGMELSALNELSEAVLEATRLDGQMTCTGAEDLIGFSQSIKQYPLHTRRTAALLRYYASEDGAEVSETLVLERSIAKALLGWLEGAPIDATLKGVRSIIALHRLHAESKNHRKAVMSASRVACFCCLRRFEPTAIREWCDDDQTAVCPCCYVDAVIPRGPIDLDQETLEHMERYWFGLKARNSVLRAAQAKASRAALEKIVEHIEFVERAPGWFQAKVLGFLLSVTRREFTADGTTLSWSARFSLQLEKDRGAILSETERPALTLDDAKRAAVSMLRRGLGLPTLTDEASA